MKTIYVVGYLFSEDTTQVLLIRKARPEWQAGFCNGVGGKVNTSESPLQAMYREFKEETGELSSGWELFAVHTSSDFIIYYYRAFNDSTIEMVLSRVAYPTDETPELWPVVPPVEEIITNCAWTIPLGANSGNLALPVIVEDK